jgi:hypothetical protein
MKMNVEYLDSYLPIVFREHLRYTLERYPRYYLEPSYLNSYRKDRLIDELFQTRKDFLYRYIRCKDSELTMDWVYNQKGLLEDLVSYLNRQYRRQKLKFFVLENEVILRQFYVDKMISPKDVLTFYLDTKYEDIIEPSSLDFFESIVIKK